MGESDDGADPERSQRVGGRLRKTTMIVVLCVVGAGVPIGWLIATTVWPSHDPDPDSRSNMEYKRIGDLMACFQLLALEPDNLADLKKPSNAHLEGRSLYEHAFRSHVFVGSHPSKLVSFRSGVDTESKPDWIDNPEKNLPPELCSYTAPRAGELADVLNSKERFVVISFNSRNWNNYPDRGVLCAWTHFRPGTIAEVSYMTFEDASQDWGITQAEWDDPAGKLFGKKAPFQHTYE